MFDSEMWDQDEIAARIRAEGIRNQLCRCMTSGLTNEKSWSVFPVKKEANNNDNPEE